jgi:hypothetical protein
MAKNAIKRKIKMKGINHALVIKNLFPPPPSLKIYNAKDSIA